MASKFYQGVSLLVLCSVLSSATALSAQTVLVSENWSEYGEGTSPIGNGYAWGVTTNPSNTATIVKDAATEKKILRVLSFGGTVYSAPRVQKSVALDLRESLTTTISGELRYQAPGSTRNGGYPSFGINTNLGGQIWYGFSALNAVFINMPTPAGGTAPTQLKLTLGANVNPLDWYRFTVNLDHTTGYLGLSVMLLDGMGGNVVDTIWSISNVLAGYDAMNITDITAYRFEVSRPGSPTGNQITSDFGAFTIETVLVPEPSTLAALMGLGALGLVIALRRRRSDR